MATRRLRRGRIWRRRAVALAVVAVALIAGYYLWLRDSSLVAVEEVVVKGATTDRERITVAIEGAAEGMTTLHIDDDELREAVSQFPTVASVKADSTLLHKLTVTVTERLPVARIRSSGETLAVSADGYVLPGVEAAEQPAIEGRTEAGRLDAEAAAQAAIVGAAPEELRESIRSATWDEERTGVVVEMEGAPELRFGDGSEAEDKWTAVVAVLTDPGVGTPAYVNVEVPERAVSGG
jgi:cell division protein FtsQ